MSSVAPQVSTRDIETTAPELLDSDPAKVWATQVRDSYNQNGFEATSLQATSILFELSSTPRFFCMARHLLSSIVRVSNLAPEQLEISGKLLRSHLKALSLSGKIDRAAAPIQAQGIPIVCGDVPEILAW